MSGKWAGVYPAVTTKFKEDFSLDHAEMERGFNYQLEGGVHGLICCGSLGENSTLTMDEKFEVFQVAKSVSSGKVPVILTLAEASTVDACTFASRAEKEGADGLMVLPPMRYPSDRRETMQYLRTIAAASDLPIMIYNNPVAYTVDVTPEMFAELAEEPKFTSIKESSDNIRRVTDIINIVGTERYQIFCGVDNIAFESILMGSVGWVAGLVCAFPKETVKIYELAMAGRVKEAREIYRWFMPLLHLDVSTKLVQNIKLAEEIVGCGNDRVRPPRLALVGEERKHVEKVIRDALAVRPDLSRY